MGHVIISFSTKSIFFITIFCVGIMALGGCSEPTSSLAETGPQSVGGEAIQWQDARWAQTEAALPGSAARFDSLSGKGVSQEAVAAQFQLVADSLDARHFDPIERWAFSGAYPALPLADYLYLWQNDTLRLHSYAPHVMQTQWSRGTLKVVVEGDYPFEESLRITLYPERADTFALWLRIPGWAAYNQPGYQEPYRYAFFSNRKIRLVVNGVFTWPQLENGYAKLHRYWQPGDQVELTFPLALRRVRHQARHPGEWAFMRGPLVLGAKPEATDSLAPLWRLTEPVLIWQEKKPTVQPYVSLD